MDSPRAGRCRGSLLAGPWIFACLRFAASSPAAVIHVCPDGGGDAPTITDAYALAVPGDEISLCAGTFYEHDIPMKSGVHLYSLSDDPANTIIDAQQLGRCLEGADVEGPVIRSITFQNGTHPQHGGLVLGGVSVGAHRVVYENCVFRWGVAPSGGAVSMQVERVDGPTFHDCLFEENHASSADGGALWTYGSGAGASHRCTFRGNTAAGRGGAVYTFNVDGSYYQAVDCVFEQNSAGGDGGAIFDDGFSDGKLNGTSIASCRFVGNTAANGGAARLTDADVVNHSTFLDNEATGSGGALLLVSIRPGEDNLGWYNGNLFAGNVAGATGGAFAVLGSSTFFMRENTFVANGAPEGGHYWANTSPWIRWSILAFATAGGAAAGPATTTTECLNVFGNSGGDFVGPLAGSAGISGNFSADPLFCDPDVGDYTLQADSPCAPPGLTGCGLVGAREWGAGR